MLSKFVLGIAMTGTLVTVVAVHAQQVFDRKEMKKGIVRDQLRIKLKHERTARSIKYPESHDKDLSTKEPP